LLVVLTLALVVVLEELVEMAEAAAGLAATQVKVEMAEALPLAQVLAAVLAVLDMMEKQAAAWVAAA
jgi:hypothetical protein